MQCERTRIVTSVNGMTGDVIFDVPIIENVYTKSEVDYLLSQKADIDNVYNKDEIDSLLEQKADTEAVYTKSQIDVMMEQKANIDIIPTKLSDLEQDIEYADKNYVDEKIGSIDTVLFLLLGDE